MDRIDAAFRAAPRDRFLPPGVRGMAKANIPLRLSHGQTNSQPSTVADMLALLDVQAGHKVLDVGAGSGWTTALLAYLVGPSGRVIGVERIPALRAGAAEAVAEGGTPWADVRLAIPGVLGVPEEAPFDRILVSAEATRNVPTELVAQLGPAGIMVVPVRGVMTRLGRGADGQVTRTTHGYYSFVPLIED